MHYIVKIMNIYHITNAYVFHYLFSINVDVKPLVVNAAQHNITIVYISTLRYQKDTFDLKSIPSQKGIKEQPLIDITVSMLTNSTICNQILIQCE